MNRIVSVSCFLLIASSAFCHESPSHRIEDLTEQISNRGSSSERLLARAYEWKAIGHWNEAAEDFAAALEISPNLPEAILGLARIRLYQGDAQTVINLASRGYTLNLSSDERAHFHAIHAQALEKLDFLEEARVHWKTAINSSRVEIDWYLHEAHVLYHLERYNERVACLERAMQKNRSIVLERAWIRALIDAGHAEQALNEIDNRLVSARLKSSWLLLRAQAFAALEMQDRQRADANQAYEEIRMRLNPTHPDVQLLIEASHALAYCGRIREAKTYRQEAQRRGASKEAFDSLEKFF